MQTGMRDADINEYDYDLPAERIAQHPLRERDGSKLLLYRNGTISEDRFSNISAHIPDNSIIVFNNSRVVHARLLFRKDTGAEIEILCLEPVTPSDYAESFSAPDNVTWKCMVGNLKKWKEGSISLRFTANGKEEQLSAFRLEPAGDAWNIRFIWSGGMSFAEVTESAGHVPLPPYINRGDDQEDRDRYQTVYSTVKGSVAAPTAGLHFTARVLDDLMNHNIEVCNVTLHVGAGTFQPVKSRFISQHRMHCEHIFLDLNTLARIATSGKKLVAAGTTSLRTLETLYWLGVKVIDGKADKTGMLSLDQWEAYSLPGNIPATEALLALHEYVKNSGRDKLHASTSLIIVPGYVFRLTGGLITNFHQPRSTLLLLVSAWTGDKWKDIYDYALKNGFRFLSYGDSSLLLKDQINIP